MAEQSGVKAPEQIASEMFLSPRVIDQRSFEELSTLLRGLVKDAASQGRTLISTTGEVKSISQQLREATKELQTRVETALRVVPTLDQRATKAEQLLERATGELTAREQSIRELVSREASLDKSALQKLVQEHLGSVVREKLSGFADDLSKTALATHESQRKEIEGTLARLEAARRLLDADAGAIETRLGASVSRAAETSDRVRTEIDAKLAELERAADQAAATHADAMAAKIENAVRERIALSREQFEDVLRQTEARLAEREARTQQRLEEATRGAQERLGDALRAMAQGVGALEERAANVGTQLDARLSRFKDEAQGVVRALAEHANEQAEQAIASGRTGKVIEEANDLAARLTQASAEARATQRDAGALLRELAAMRERADESHARLAKTLAGGGGNLDALEQKIDQVRAGHDLIRNALSEVMVKAQQVDIDLERHADTQREAMERVAKPILEGVAEQVRQMGQWLSQLLQEASVAGKALELAARERPADRSAR